MPIPQTRRELIRQLEDSFEKLHAELNDGEPTLGSLPCVDAWTVKDLLAVRAWWTENVVAWIREGCAGGTPVTPAPGYRWKETPRLNADIVKAARRDSYNSVRARLERGYADVLRLIDELGDRELLRPGVFPWAGRYPIRRWISLNTVRQYTTARTFIRRAMRERG